MDTITQMASGDGTLCPVRAAAAIVKRVKKYPGSSQQTPISTVLNHRIIEHITSDHTIDTLRNAVGAIGKAKLGFKKEDVSTHSIRLSAAMAMYLGECPVCMIMLIGCGSSDAFLRYIRKQVMEFSQTWPRKWSRAKTSGTSQTSTREYSQMTHASEITLATLRQEETLVVTQVAVLGCPHLPCSTENLLSEWLVLLLMVETHWKADPGLGEGVSNRLLEHRFKPSPSGRTLFFGCFAYFIFYILQVHLFNDLRQAKDPSSEPLSLPGDCDEERESVRSPHTFLCPFLAGGREPAVPTYMCPLQNSQEILLSKSPKRMPKKV